VKEEKMGFNSFRSRQLEEKHNIVLQAQLRGATVEEAARLAKLSKEEVEHLYEVFKEK
jgi:hypothetical protein